MDWRTLSVLFCSGLFWVVNLIRTSARISAHRLSPPTVQGYEISVLMVLYYCRSLKVISEKFYYPKYSDYVNVLFFICIFRQDSYKIAVAEVIWQIRIIYRHIFFKSWLVYFSKVLFRLQLAQLTGCAWGGKLLRFNDTYRTNHNLTLT